MLRKITLLLSVFALAVTLSCSDNEAIVPDGKATVAPPPISININARLEYCITTSPVIDVYHRVNAGFWYYVGSVSSTSCGSIGSISASTGDIVEFAVVDYNTGDAYSYRGRVGAGCPNTTFPGFCGDGTFGDNFTHTVKGTTTDLSLQINVNYTYPYCGSLAPC